MDSTDTVVPAPPPPTSPVAVDPAPAPVPVPKPGYLTSEAWLTFLTMLVGAIPSSGLVDNAPLLAKIVGMVIAALAAIHYTAQRTALKRAYAAALSAGGASAAPRSSKLPAVITSAALVLAVAVAVIASSCSGGINCRDPQNAQSAKCVVEGALVDCTGISSLPTAIAVAEPVVEKLFQSAKQADGSIAFSSIESQLVALALQYGPCVIAEIWNHYTGGAPAGSGMTARTAVANKADFAAEFDRIRTRVAPGYKFKTSGGTL